MKHDAFSLTCAAAPASPAGAADEEEAVAAEAVAEAEAAAAAALILSPDLSHRVVVANKIQALLLRNKLQV